MDFHRGRLLVLSHFLYLSSPFQCQMYVCSSVEKWDEDLSTAVPIFFPEQRNQFGVRQGICAGKMIFLHKLFAFLHISMREINRYLQGIKPFCYCHYFIHCIPPMFIFFVCLTSRCTDFSCNSVLSCKKCTCLRTFAPKSTGLFCLFPIKDKAYPSLSSSVYPLQHLSLFELNCFIACNIAFCLLLCQCAWGISNLL